MEARVPEVELKVKREESVSRPPVVAKGTRPEVRLETVREPAVALPSAPTPRLKFVEKRLVELAVVLKREVVVAEVPVARVKMRSVRLTVVPKRLVKVPLVLKREVVVAAVPVALTKVKFWRVVEAVRSRLESEVRPPVAVTVPVKLATLEMVCPLMRPEVTGPATRVPILPLVEKRLVDEAVVEKKLVVVAEVPVARSKERLVKSIVPAVKLSKLAFSE